jgi:curli biogenesis system outer membrane secretion channel CsgG
MKRIGLTPAISLIMILLPPMLCAQGPGRQQQAARDRDRSAAPGAATSMANWTGPKLRLAVMDINGSALKSQTYYQPSTVTNTQNIAPPADFARGMTEMLTTALTKTDKFVVLERAALEKVTSEQDLGAGGRVNAETAPQVGKIIGAQAIITGDITEFSYAKTAYGGKLSVLHGFGAKLDKVNAQVALDIRVVDAVTGQVIVSQRSQGKATMSDVAADLTRGDQSFSAAAAENTPLGKATRQALEGAVSNIVTGMRKVRWSGKVIDVRDGMLYVNAGSALGIQPGLEFDVYRPQQGLVDPETGQSLGAPDVKIGSVTVQSVQEKYSVGKVTSGEQMKRGDIVRLKGDAQQP